MSFIKLNLKDMTVPEKITFGQQVITMVTGNANFPGAAALLAAFTSANTQLETDYNTAQNARQTSVEKTSVTQSCESDWDAAMTDLGLDIQIESGGDAAKIQSAGLEVRNTPSPIGQLAAPTDAVVVTNGLSGVLKVTWKRPYGAKTYVVQRALDPNLEANWQQVGLPASTRFEDSGLTPGTKYWYRVAANGTAGLSGWSDPACAMAV